MDYTYAYNYWRKVFVDQADGHFTEKDFEKWFWAGAKPVAGSMGYFGTIETDEAGSKEHFNQVMRRVFIDMLSACADGRFGK